MTGTRFRAALRDWTVAVFNFVYADSSGRVGYQCAGRVPIRGRATRGYRDANEPADQWRGYIPFEALPHAVDPRARLRGQCQRARRPGRLPVSAARQLRRRSSRRADSSGASKAAATLDRDQSVALQNDVKSCRAERLCPPLVDWLAQSADPDVVQLRDALAAWDYRYTLESAAPTLFETFMEVWQDRVARERFPRTLRAAGARPGRSQPRA